MKRIVLFSAFIVFMGLLLWNVYLTNKINTFSQNADKIQLKLDMCQGELNVLSYDLITARDSLRILQGKDL